MLNFFVATPHHSALHIIVLLSGSDGWQYFVFTQKAVTISLSVRLGE